MNLNAYNQGLNWDLSCGGALVSMGAHVCAYGLQNLIDIIK